MDLLPYSLVKMIEFFFKSSLPSLTIKYSLNAQLLPLESWFSEKLKIGTLGLFSNESFLVASFSLHLI